MQRLSRLGEVLSEKEENYILPFLWLHGKEEAVLRGYMQKIWETGIRAVCLESRPHPDFAGELWWNDVAIILDEAKKLDMKVWILDDAHFPTGFANGKLKDADDKLKRKFLIHREFDVEGPLSDYRIRVDLENGLGVMGTPLSKHPSRLMACLMAKRIQGEMWKGTLDDLTEHYSKGWVTFDVPEGKYRITLIIEQTGAASVQQDYINMLDKSSVKILVDEVYESHYAHFGEYFGTTLMGFFSDEPGFYNLTNRTGFSMDMKIGTEMPLPWDESVESRLKERLGNHIRRDLPLLWFEGGEAAQRIRYHYMDIVTDLYRENFSQYLGKWCEDHGVEYIGHIIEDNNVHARLGPSCGHYFKAVQGQHMSGIDVVQHQIMPEMKEDYFSFVLNKEADGAFYYYGLAKLGTSMAHFERKTKGRALCELYGAYGWMEGISLMKWLTDHMLVRGINVYVPHAFSEKDFPDPDCPPHFYGHGKNTQFPYMKYLFNYLNRACHLLSDGRPSIHVAVVYHAEMEWMGETMMFHHIGKELMDQQMDYDVIPMERLLTFQVKDSKLQENELPRDKLQRNKLQSDKLQSDKLREDKLQEEGVSYQCVFVPGAEKYPQQLIDWVDAVREKGLPVFQVISDKFDNEALPIPEIKLDKVAKVAEKFGCKKIKAASSFDYLRYYRYLHEKENMRIHMFFNESTLRTVDTAITMDDHECGFIYVYDPYENCLLKKLASTDRTIMIHLEPTETLFLIETDENYEIKDGRLKSYEDKQEIQSEFSFEITASYFDNTDKIEFIGHTCELKDFFKWRPDFAGYIYYKTWLDKQAGSCELDLGKAYEAVEVFVNGQSAGVKINKPYRFDLSNMLNKEKNEVIIKVATNLVYALCDRFSRNVAIPPMGLLGPVKLYKHQ